MRVGVVGAGKLGLPVACAMQFKGHDVVVNDANPNVAGYLKDPDTIPYQEAGLTKNQTFPQFLKAQGENIPRHVGMEELCEHSDIIFVAVQTPHDPKYEGITPAPWTAKDFEYQYLRNAVYSTIPYVRDGHIVAVISTCLPGTMRREIMPFLPNDVFLVYNPSFIAMGTTIMDFLDPEFVLIGSDELHAAAKVKEFYSTVTEAVPVKMSIESAELTKVAYNTAITAKIALANTVMEVCHKIPKADVDDVTSALSMADKRIVSARYMDGGMGDGGGCHPRDLIAMRYLSYNLELSDDIYYWLTINRENQARFFAKLMLEQLEEHMLPLWILGYAYKPETNLSIGSHALLVESILKAEGHAPLVWDTDVAGQYEPKGPAIFLIGCRHERYHNFQFARGSVVIDPFRYIKNQDGVKIIRVGEGELSK